MGCSAALLAVCNVLLAWYTPISAYIIKGWRTAQRRGFVKALYAYTHCCMVDFSFSFPPWPFASNVEPALDNHSQNSDDGTRDTYELLRHFDGSGYSLPPSARVDPTVRQRERKSLGFFDLWKYVAFVLSRTLAVGVAFVTHYLWGPRKKSWGWQMTFVSSVMRNASDHSHLADIPTLRRFINMAGYAPLPSDAMVTPVTFSVRRRNLRGLLADLDRRENGKRELSGEWVVGRKLWQKLQAEWRASRGTSSSNGKARPPDTPKRKDRVILYLHGGAYYMFSAATHRQLTIQLAKYTESRIFAVDYRLAPEIRFPGQIHDAVSAYMRLLELKVPPENILLAGDSAGGALSLSLLMYLRDNDYPLPAGAILMSPWVDLTMSCDSWDTNAPFDIIPPPKPGDHLNPISCYLGENLEKLIAHPYASPLFGDFHGLPPLLIQAGDSEVLRDEITLLTHKARLAGVQVRYELYEDAVHVFQQFSFLENSHKALQASREFVMKDLPVFQKRSPQYLAEGTQLQLNVESANEHTRKVSNDGSGGVKERQRPPSPANEDTDGGCRPLNGDVKLRDVANGGTSTFLETVKERTSEPDPNIEEKRKWSALRRRLGFTPVQKEKAEDSLSPNTNPPPRNHHRHATGELHPPSLLTPAPSIRMRSRAASHPDISSLCQQWVNSEPSERSLTYVPASRPNIKV